MNPNILLKNKSGIYGIRNLKNNKLYVGKTKCFYNRCHQYIYEINRQNFNHINSYFLNSINKYGIENFEFFVIEYIDNLDLISDRELYWIDYYNTTDSSKGYNLRRDSSTNMIVHSKTSKKISNRLKKEWKEGLRNNHSEKLKKSWKDNHSRKQQQSEIMSKNLTKYSYNLYDNQMTFIKNVFYNELQEMKLQNVIATMFKKKSNKVLFKGYYIEKISSN